MLVLSRKANESIHIGSNIVITVLKVKGQAISLGIEAPRDIKVMRPEVLARLRGKQMEAASNDTTSEALPQAAAAVKMPRTGVMADHLRRRTPHASAPSRSPVLRSLSAESRSDAQVDGRSTTPFVR